MISTDVFERFCETGNLRERAAAAECDAEVARLFLDAPLGDELMEDLKTLLSEARYPLAVRSSSLLEDSEFHPLAGLYKTIMLPNSSASEATRLEQLSRAIRLIWASTFFIGPRTYMEATSQRMEEERMAVIIERLVGRPHGDRFYPDFAGVAQSRNFYPMGSLAPEDGIATVALGLGETVVSGGKALRFSPRRPGVLPQMGTPAEALRNSQRELVALDLGDPERTIDVDESVSLVRFGLEVAETDGTLAAAGATYSPDDDRIHDSLFRKGARLVTFAGVLKHDVFPLAPLLDELLTAGREGMGTAVELEFAVVLGADDQPSEMAVVQLRPLMAQEGEGEVSLAGEPDRPHLLAGPALGNGVVRDLRDVVYLHPERLDFGEEPRAGARAGPAQRPARPRPPPLPADGAGTVGDRRPLAGRPGDLGRGLGGAGDRRAGAPGLGGRGLPGEPLLPQHHVAAGGLLLHPHGRRRTDRRPRLAREPARRGRDRRHPPRRPPGPPRRGSTAGRDGGWCCARGAIYGSSR